MPKKILIVDDEVDTLNLLATTLAVAGYETAKASSGGAGISLITEFKPDVIILDVMMPEQSGIEVLNIIHKVFVDPPPVIIFSARGRIEDMSTAWRPARSNTWSSRCPATSCWRPLRLRWRPRPRPS